MDKLMARLIKENTPEVNSDIVSGLATKMMVYAENYVDQVFRAAARSFPEGMEYLGCRRCTPQEEYAQITRMRPNNRRTFEAAPSDLYYMKYMFSYKGEELPPKYMYLPFVGPGNVLTLSGSKYAINPMLSDKVISPSSDSVFVRLLRDKIIFNRLSYPIRINGAKRSAQVVWTHLYRKNRASKDQTPDTSKVVTTLAHYLVAKFGLSQFFRKYFDFEPIVSADQKEIDTYSYNDYAIFSTGGLKSRRSKLHIIIPWTKMTPVMEDIIAGIFYVIDHFPDKMTLELVDDSRAWMELLGSIHFSDAYNRGKLVDKTREHFNSLDQYIDALVSKKLRESGYPCEDFYDLLLVIIEHFTEWAIMSSSNVNSMFGKELAVLYHVFYAITYAIFDTAFKLSKVELRKRDRNRSEITAQEITQDLNKTLKPGLIFDLASSNSCATSTSYPGDNMFFKITSMISPQTANQGRKKKGKARTSEDDPVNKLHPSIAVAGGFLNLPKKSPTGTTRVNPFTRLDESGTILVDPESQALIEEIERLLRD